MRQTYENATRQQFTAQAFQWGAMALAGLFALTVASDALSAVQSIALF